MPAFSKKIEFIFLLGAMVAPLATAAEANSSALILVSKSVGGI